MGQRTRASPNFQTLFPSSYKRISEIIGAKDFNIKGETGKEGTLKEKVLE